MLGSVHVPGILELGNVRKMVPVSKIVFRAVVYTVEPGIPLSLVVLIVEVRTAPAVPKVIDRTTVDVRSVVVRGDEAPPIWIVEVRPSVDVDAPARGIAVREVWVVMPGWIRHVGVINYPPARRIERSMIVLDAPPDNVSLERVIRTVVRPGVRVLSRELLRALFLRLTLCIDVPTESAPPVQGPPPVAVVDGVVNRLRGSRSVVLGLTAVVSASVRRREETVLVVPGYLVRQNRFIQVLHAVRFSRWNISFSTISLHGPDDG